MSFRAFPVLVELACPAIESFPVTAQSVGVGLRLLATDFNDRPVQISPVFFINQHRLSDRQFRLGL